MFLGINSIYTPVYLPLCEYGQNQPPCADVGLLLNMARTCSFHSLVWAILRSNPPSLHVGWFFKIYPSGALGVYFPIYTPRSIYRSVYLIEYLWRLKPSGLLLIEQLKRTFKVLLRPKECLLNKLCKALLSCSNKIWNYIELHVSSLNWMHAHWIACKLTELYELMNCVEAYVIAC